MALTTTQIIQLQCDALYADSALNTWIAYAQEKTSSCFFGSSYAEAVALLACHLYTLKNRGSGESGVVTSKREGDLSLSFGGITVKTDLDQTIYGTQLKRIIRSANGAVTIVGAAEAGLDPENGVSS